MSVAGRIRLTLTIVCLGFVQGLAVVVGESYDSAVRLVSTQTITEETYPAVPPGIVPHCTSAPGPAGAFPYECVDATTEGKIDQVSSHYYYHTPTSMVNGSTVCDRHHEADYYSGGVRKTMTISPPSCLNPAAVYGPGDYVIFNLPERADRNRPICVRVKNSATSNAWTNFACVPGTTLD